MFQSQIRRGSLIKLREFHPPLAISKSTRIQLDELRLWPSNLLASKHLKQLQGISYFLILFSMQVKHYSSLSHVSISPNGRAHERAISELVVHLLVLLTTHNLMSATVCGHRELAPRAARGSRLGASGRQTKRAAQPLAREHLAELMDLSRPAGLAARQPACSCWPISASLSRWTNLYHSGKHIEARNSSGRPIFEGDTCA